MARNPFQLDGLMPVSGLALTRCNLDASYLRNLVDQNSVSWNHLMSWIRRVDGLRLVT
jgi:hypothetical protein